MIAAIVSVAAFGFIAYQLIAQDRGVLAEVRGEAEQAKLAAACNAGLYAAIHGLGDPDPTQRWGIDGRSRPMQFGDTTLLITVEDVSVGKPDPEGYLRAAGELGVSPSRCLVVEDSVTGVTAAVAAGMPVLGYIGGAHSSATQIRVLREAGALCVFEDMRQLPAMVAQLSAARALRATQN